MQDLRLIGVHEDGAHLLLADAQGHHYRIALDEPLRAAARRDRPRLGQLQIEMEGGLRPRDVQAMIRSGLTAEEAAERAGWTVEKVHRYEGPILAEREHVARLAQQVRLRARGGAQGAAPTLVARVSERMRSREIDPDTARWDSYRTETQRWVVVLLFAAGGREREAAWDFDPLARTVAARDDEARWLSEDEEVQMPGPLAAPHLSTSARPSDVYDVEAEGGVNAPPRPRPRSADTVDLMEAMRERSSQRGRRRRGRGADVPGIDNAPEEALPIEELAQPLGDELPPPAHPHPADDPEARPTREGRRRARQGTPQESGDDGTVEPGWTGPGPDDTQPLHTQPVDTAAAGDADSDTAPVDDEDLDAGPVESPTAPGPVDTGATEAGDGEPDDDDPVVAEEQAPKPGPKAPGSVRELHRPRRRDGSAGRADGRGRDRDQDPADDADLDPPADEASETRARPSSGGTTARGTGTTRKSGRPSVPSWDDIMFGRKGD